MNYLRILFSLPLLFSVSVTYALTIVHMETQLDTTTSDIYFELYEDVAPNNVSNFLGYVNRGDYDSSFFHRKAQYGDGSPFVVQGGGFTYVPQYDPDARFYATFGATNLVEFADPDTGELGLRPIGEVYVVDANNDDIPDEDPPGSGNVIERVNEGLKEVPVDTSVLPVISEASLSNLRGTIAMALAGGDFDSASNQWFINLSDNTQLDPTASTDGFTVFGRVLGSGIDFFDTVNNDLIIYPLAYNVNPEFGEIPVINYTPYTLMLGENLVRLNSASEVMNIDITDHDFGFVDVGNVSQVVITLAVSAQWKSDLDISVGDMELLDPPPFTASNTCESATIAPGNTCTITITFAPTTADNFQDTLDIKFNGLSIPNLSINITGTSRTLPKVAPSTGNTLDFQYVYPGIPELQTITITNLGQQELVFTSIDIDDTANFTATDDCVSLLYNESCDVVVTFSTPVEGMKTALMTITTNAPELPYQISLLGTGSFTIIPDIDAETVYDFGDLLNGTEVSGSVTLTNRGSYKLKLLSTSLTGDDSSDFSSSNCITELAPGESCTLSVGFSPSTVGAKKTSIKVSSNDPDEPEFIIALTGTSSSDSDNVPDAEEDAAPNNGDGDSDSVKDKLQSNVVSIVAANGKHMTLIVSNLMSFRDTAIIDNPSPGDMPSGAKFDHGILNFSLGFIPTTASYKVGMILPADQPLNKLYQYGPTPDDPVPHWYEFMFDAETGTGAQIYNNVSMTAPNGSVIQRNIVQIWYADGRRGDDDLTVNGTITSTQGLSIVQPSGDAPASLNGYLAILLMIIVFNLRRLQNNSSPGLN